MKLGGFNCWVPNVMIDMEKRGEIKLTTMIHSKTKKTPKMFYSYSMDILVRNVSS